MIFFYIFYNSETYKPFYVIIMVFLLLSIKKQAPKMGACFNHSVMIPETGNYKLLSPGNAMPVSITGSVELVALQVGVVSTDNVGRVCGNLGAEIL